MSKAWAGLVIGMTAAVAVAQAPPVPEQDPELLRFVERAVGYHPESSLQLTEDKRTPTPSGSYRTTVVERSCPVKFFSGPIRVVIDEGTATAWLGPLAALPAASEGLDLAQLRPYLESTLPDLLEKSLRLKAKVDWDAGGARAGALIPFHLRVDTGYGEFRRLVAVTADGQYMLLGYALPYDRDPVGFRRQLLLESPDVSWDRPPNGAKAEIVEFSDFECPGCKAKWPVIAEVLQKHGEAVQHGFAAFPLTTIHPWSFRAASAGWCVARQQPALLNPLKELFYSLQKEMEVAEVTETTLDFATAHALKEEGFKSCYLKAPSLDGVHAQMALGHRLGVQATPTYFVNGWMVQVPETSWLEPMIASLLAGQEP